MNLCVGVQKKKKKKRYRETETSREMGEDFLILKLMIDGL